VQSSDFGTVGLMMQLIGGLILLIALPLCLIHWALAAVVGSIGLCFFVPGRAIYTYRMWGWYAAVLVAMPLSLLGVLVAMVFMRLSMVHLLELMTLPVLIGWVGWVLLSNSGRDRYRVLCEAAALRKSRPKHTAEYQDLELGSVPAESSESPAIEEIDPFARPGESP
jgi:hypothetical protein